MKKRMYKIMALAMTAAMVVPMAAQTTAFAADDKEITYWNIAVESPDKDIVTAAVDKFFLVCIVLDSYLIYSIA